MATLGLSATNLAPGAKVSLETSSLPSGVLELVAASATAPTRALSLTDAKADSGIPLTAAAGTPTGAVGIARTAGTSLTLVGEATSSSAKTDKVIWEFSLPTSYNAGNAVPVKVNAQVTGSGTITGASTTLSVAAYSEVNGVETALVVSGGAQQFSSQATLTWSVAATGLAPGSHLVIEITMLVTSASGANTGQINAVSYNA